MSHASESLTLIERGNALTIVTAVDYNAAAEFLQGATALKRQILDHYKPLKQAADNLHTQLVDAEKDQLKPLLSVIARVTGEMVGFSNRQARLAEEQQKAIQKQADKARGKGTLAPVQVQVPVDVPVVRGISNRSTWKAEVVDAALVPREYMVPDMKALNDAAKRMKGEFNIPGCKAIEDVNVIVKGV